MRNKLFRLISIILIGIFIQSCSTQKSVTSQGDVDQNSSISNVIEESPNVAPRRSFLEDVGINLLENDNLTDQQKRFVEKATNVIKKETYHLVLEEDGIEVDVIIFGDKTRVLMSMDDIQKINNKYRMTEILEDLVNKYNIENELNLTIVESLTNEVILLNEKVSLLNDELKNKDKIISKLEEIIEELKGSNEILSEINGLQADEIKSQRKEIKKQKTQKTIIAAGSAVVILLLLLSGF